MESLFQSAPLTEARGDAVRTLVDICEDKFQSAPLTEARGDVLIGRRQIPPHRFNPLPSPKRGEIEKLKLDGIMLSFVSIRSPHRSEGRSARPITSEQKVKFQSAPLTEARGDPNKYRLTDFDQQFQSAPLTEAREMA